MFASLATGGILYRISDQRLVSFASGAAAGPVMVGVLRDASGSWTLPLIAAIMAALAVTGLLAGRDRVISGST